VIDSVTSHYESLNYFRLRSHRELQRSMALAHIPEKFSLLRELPSKQLVIRQLIIALDLVNVGN